MVKVPLFSGVIRIFIHNRLDLAASSLPMHTVKLNINSL